MALHVGCRGGCRETFTCIAALMAGRGATWLWKQRTCARHRHKTIAPNGPLQMDDRERCRLERSEDYSELMSLTPPYRVSPNLASKLRGGLVVKSRTGKSLKPHLRSRLSGRALCGILSHQRHAASGITRRSRAALDQCVMSGAMCEISGLFGAKFIDSYRGKSYSFF